MEGPIQLSVKYRIPDYAVVTGNEIIFKPIVASSIFMRAQAHLYANTAMAERTVPFTDRCSRLVELNETITLPAYKNAIYVPTQNEIDGSAASFAGAYEIGTNEIKIAEKIVIKKRVFEANEWTNYKSVVEAQQKFAKENLILVR
jgi:hypothetical protein